MSSVKVKATARGYYQHVVIEPGQVFWVDKKVLKKKPSWFHLVDDEPVVSRPPPPAEDLPDPRKEPVDPEEAPQDPRLPNGGRDSGNKVL